MENTEFYVVIYFDDEYERKKEFSTYTEAKEFYDYVEINENYYKVLQRVVELGDGEEYIEELEGRIY